VTFPENHTLQNQWQTEQMPTPAFEEKKQNLFKGNEQLQNEQ
jgi:hypothetical protein